MLESIRPKYIECTWWISPLDIDPLLNVRHNLHLGKDEKIMNVQVNRFISRVISTHKNQRFNYLLCVVFQRKIRKRLQNSWARQRTVWMFHCPAACPVDRCVCRQWATKCRQTLTMCRWSSWQTPISSNATAHRRELWKYPMEREEIETNVNSMTQLTLNS